MDKKKEHLIINRLKSIKYAVKGAVSLIWTESSVQIQFVIGIIMMFVGFYFNISKTEWMIQILCIGLIMSIEGLNTAVEKISDFVHPDYHKVIGKIKDVAAGAVFFAAITAVIIGTIIYLPKILQL